MLPAILSEQAQSGLLGANAASAVRFTCSILSRLEQVFRKRSGRFAVCQVATIFYPTGSPSSTRTSSDQPARRLSLKSGPASSRASRASLTLV